MKVTIVTPVFNGAEKIERCIKSVQFQTYPNIEHIVIDGGSSDRTVEILDKYQVKYTSERDAGIYDAMNKGIARATGDIIGILNSDDMYFDNNVVKDVVDVFSSFSCDLCHGKVIQVNSNGKPIWTIGRSVSFEDLLKKMKVAHPSVFVRRNIYENYGSYSVGFRIAGDYDFLLRIWSKVQVCYVDRVMVMMDINGVSNSNLVDSYREALAVCLIHSKDIIKCYINFFVNIISGNIVRFLRRFGVKKLSN